MPDCQNNRGNSLCTLYMVPLYLFETRDTSLKPDLSAVGEDTFAHVLDDGRQFVGTDMRVRFVEDGVGCSEEMEELHDALHVSAFFGTGEEFAIGERTGSAFTEAVVRLGVQTLIAIK